MLTKLKYALTRETIETKKFDLPTATPTLAQRPPTDDARYDSTTSLSVLFHGSMENDSSDKWHRDQSPTAPKRDDGYTLRSLFLL